MPVTLFIPIFIVLFLVAVVVFIIWAAKNGGFSTKRDSKITLREGETPILATEIVWFRKSMYMNKNKIPPRRAGHHRPAGCLHPGVW